MSLAPELKMFAVETRKLLLDPNNPRLFTQEEERVPFEQIQDPGFQRDTAARIDAAGDKFRISDLVDSIRTNGYIPEAGGYIFVRKLPRTEYYLVLEGNRRLIAIQKMLIDKDNLLADAPDILRTLSPIDVLEIVDDLPEEEIQEKISYLLGTCHHGSHRDWSAFAQARGIYSRYIKINSQNDTTFEYNTDGGRKVASLLSTTEGEVKERLMVYRAMKQLASAPELMKLPNGGIMANYYSLIKEAVWSTKSEIKQYIPKDPNTFMLQDIAIQRMINLCHFDGTRDRKYKNTSGKPVAPAMKNPKQWQYLSKILADTNGEKREKNTALVEKEHQYPEEVWARRYAELLKYTWKKWLEQIHGILNEVGMGEDFESDAARAAIIDTNRIVITLGEDNGGSDA